MQCETSNPCDDMGKHEKEACEGKKDGEGEGEGDEGEGGEGEGGDFGGVGGHRIP
jgi:hypothetical protein